MSKLDLKKGDRAEKFVFGTITVLLIFNAWDEMKEAATYGVAKATAYQLRSCQEFITHTLSLGGLSTPAKAILNSIFDELETMYKSRF